MKKIVLLAILLTVCSTASIAQESRQDASISGTGLIQPWIAASTNVQLHSTVGEGVLASYRFMLTPSLAVEANYQFVYQSKFHYWVNPNNYIVSARVQEASGAVVKSFTYRKWNPFVEAGAAGLIFLPVWNSGTTTLDAKEQMQVGALYGAGFAYELSPSFDIRGEYRGLLGRVPTFGDTQFTTNKWFNIYNPVIGVAYHF